VQVRELEPVNILTAMAENENVVKKESDPERKAIALAWLFHLVGDIHQPLHALFRRHREIKAELAQIGVICGTVRLGYRLRNS
jgi:hypothetical protein